MYEKSIFGIHCRVGVITHTANWNVQKEFYCLVKDVGDINIRKFANYYLKRFPPYIEYYQNVDSFMQLITNNSDVLQNPIYCTYDRHVKYDLPIYHVEHLLGFFRDSALKKRNCKAICDSKSFSIVFLCYLWESYFYDGILYDISYDSLDGVINDVGSVGITVQQFKQLCKYLNYTDTPSAVKDFIISYGILLAEANINLTDLSRYLTVDLRDIDVKKTNELLAEQFEQFEVFYNNDEVPPKMFVYILKLLYTHYIWTGELFDGLCIDSILMVAGKLKNGVDLSIAEMLSGGIEHKVQEHLNILRRVESLALELGIDPFNILKHLDYNDIESSFDLVSEQLTEGSF